MRFKTIIWQRQLLEKEKNTTSLKKKAIYVFLHGVVKAYNYIDADMHKW